MSCAVSGIVVECYMYRSLDDSFEIVWWYDDGFTDNSFYCVRV